MTDTRTIQFTFAVNDPELEDAERQEIARKLLRELHQLDEVENVDFAKDSQLEAGAKSALATIVGVLTAEVSIENIQKVLGFIGDRIPNKPVVIKVKVGEQEVEIEAKSRKELEDAERVVRQLLAHGSWGAKDEQFSPLQLPCKNLLSMKGREFILAFWLRDWRREQQTQMERVQFPSWSCTTMPRRKFRQLNQQ